MPSKNKIVSVFNLYCLSLSLFICMAGLFADLLSTGTSKGSLGHLQILAIVIGVCLFVLGLILSIKGQQWKKLRLAYYNIIACVTVVILIEVVLSLYSFSSTLETTWVYEDNEVVQFDPVVGYTLKPIPTKMMRLDGHWVEYNSIFKGNNFGFPDKDDFTVKRTDKNIRIAVIGSSYTSAQFLKTNWPDRAEDMFKKQNQDIQLLNFAIGGAGFGNWERVITQVLEKQNFEIDGIIIANAYSNVLKTFFYSHHQKHKDAETGRAYIGFTPHFNPGFYPKIVEEASLHWKPGSYLVKEHYYQDILKGFRPDWAYKKSRNTNFGHHIPEFISNNYPHWFSFLKNDAPNENIPDSFSSEQLVLLNNIKSYLKKKNIPSLIVYIPTLNEILKTANRTFVHLHSKFAQQIGAEHINGEEAFKNMSSNSVRDCFFRYDGHWNQHGSDIFAKYMVNEIESRFLNKGRDDKLNVLPEQASY